MSLPVVSLTSDSDCSSSDNEHNNLNNSRINASQINSSHNQRSDFQNVQTTSQSYSFQTDVVKDPLFKIIFRDDLTSRKYRQRLEDIIKFVLMNEVDENNQNQSSLVLDIYDPKLDKVSTSQIQPAQNFMQAAPQLSSNTNYINQNAHNNILSSSTKKKPRHKRKSLQSEESVPQIPSSYCIPQSLSQSIQETSIDISHVKQEKPDNTDSSNSIKQPCEKNELLKNEKSIVQTQPSIQAALPTHSSIQEVPESSISKNVQIKQESPKKNDCSNSEKTSKASHELQETKEPTRKIEPPTPISTNPPPPMQEVPKIVPNSSMHLKEDLKTNTNFSNLEKIQSLEKVLPNCSSQQYPDTSLNNKETQLKSEFSDHNKKKEEAKKSLKHKLELFSQAIDDSQSSKKLKMKKNDDELDNNSKEIYEVILDDDDYSQLETYLETSFENNTVKIGSYGYFNPDKSVFLSKDGLTFAVPTINGKKPKILSIELDDVLKVLVHFSKTKPALFFFVTTKTAIQIRNILNMDDPSGPYFDPNSLDLKHQRIAILPAKISEESEGILKELFKDKEMVEINAQIADDLANLATTTYNKTPKNVINKYNKEVNDIIGREPPYVNNLSGHSNHGISYFCRIIRVGSLEYAKKRAMLLCHNGFKFCVPHLDNHSQIVTIHVDISDIIVVEIYFSKYIPMLFFHLTTKAAKKIRNKIGMTDEKGFYLDPKGDETRNKIIILPQTLSEGCYALREWFLKDKVKKLDKETAKDILARSFKNNKEKVYLTRSRTKNDLEDVDKFKTNTMDRSEINNEKTLNTVNNTTRTRYAEQRDNRMQYTFSTAKVIPSVEQSKNDSAEEIAETTEVISNACVRIKAECIKLGSYKYNLEQTSVIISPEGLNFDLPKIQDGTKHKMYIVIKMYEITELWYFFSIKTCFLFFTTNSACAQNIRAILGMHDNTNKAGYYNPDSEALSEKRIVIIFTQSNYKYRSILKTVFYNVKLNSIKDYKTARKMMRNKL